MQPASSSSSSSSSSSLVILPVSSNTIASSSTSSLSTITSTTPTTTSSNLINKNESFNLNFSAIGTNGGGCLSVVGSSGGGGVGNSVESHVLATAAQSTNIYKNLNKIFILSPSLTTTTSQTSNSSNQFKGQTQSSFELFPFTTASAAHFQAAVNNINCNNNNNKNNNSVNPVSSISNNKPIAPKVFPKKERLIKPNPAHLVNIRPNLFPDKALSINSSNSLLQTLQTVSPNKSETTTKTKTVKKRKSKSTVASENTFSSLPLDEKNIKPVKKRQRKKGVENLLSTNSTSTNDINAIDSTLLVKKVKRAYKRAQENDTAGVEIKAKRKRSESKKIPKKTNTNVDTVKSLNSEANTSISSSCSSFSSFSSNSGTKSNSNNSDLTTAISKSLFGKFRVRVRFKTNFTIEFLVCFWMLYFF